MIRINLAAWLFLIIAHNVFAQNQIICPVSNISTDPNDPVNNQFNGIWGNDNPYLNTFDWAARTTNSFDQISLENGVGFQAHFPSNHIIISPYSDQMGVGYEYLTNAGEPDISKRDYHIEDGWELLSVNLGTWPDGTPITTAPPGTTLSGSNTYYPQTPYIILYNKYDEKIRLFMASPVSISNGYSGVEATFQLTSSEEKYSGLFRGVLPYDVALDQETSAILSRSYNKSPNDPSRFWSTDFHISYDPCACKSKMQLSNLYRFILTSTVELKGIGVIVDRKLYDQTTGRPLFDPKFISNYDLVSDFGSITYKGALSLIEDYKNRLSNYNYKKNRYQWYNSNLLIPLFDAGTDLVTDGVVSSSLPGITADYLLNEIWWFENASKKDLEKRISDGIKSVMGKGFDELKVSMFGDKPTNPKPPSPPMISTVETRFEGDMSTTLPYSGPSIYYPGTYPGQGSVLGTELTHANYPVYNENIGLYAMLKTPNLLVKDDYVSSSELNINVEDVYNGFCCEHTILHTNTQIENDFRFKIQPIEYALNPAIDFDHDRTNIRAQVSFWLKKPVEKIDSESEKEKWDLVYPELNAVDPKTISKIEVELFNIEDPNNDLTAYLTSFNDTGLFFETPPIPLNAITNTKFVLRTKYNLDLDIFIGYEKTSQFPVGLREEIAEKSGYQIEDVKLKIFGDYYFDQIGYDGAQLNKMNTYTYRIDKNQLIPTNQNQFNTAGETFSFTKKLKDELDVQYIDISGGSMVFSPVHLNTPFEGSPNNLTYVGNRIRFLKFTSPNPAPGVISAFGSGSKINLEYINSFIAKQEGEISGEVRISPFVATDYYNEVEIDPIQGTALNAYCQSEYKADILAQGFSVPGIDYYQYAHTDRSILPYPDEEFSYYVYPNPFIEQLTINVNQDQSSVIKIYSSEGELLDSRVYSLSAGDNRFSFKNLSPGIYFLHIQNEKGLFKEKLIRSY